jgi:hypothetical protein
MSNGSGIIGGKFLGNGTLTINKFYAITNITYARTGSSPTDGSNSDYILSSYFGGSVFSSSSLSNVNILNLGQNLQNIYCNTPNIFTSLTGLSLYTDYSSFSSSANTPTARIGEYTYTINYSGSDKTFYSFNSSPIISWVYNLTSDPSTLQGISQLSSFTIENQYYSIYPFTPNSIPPEILVGNGTIITYSSSDPSVATVNSTTGEITMRNAGTVTITGVKAGTAVLTIKDPATTSAATSATYAVTVKAVRPTTAPTITFDKTSYNVGDVVTMTVNADMADSATAAALFTTALVTSASVNAVAGTTALSTSSAAHAIVGGVATYKFYAPAVSGSFTVSGKTGATVDITTAVDVSTTVAIENPAVNAAELAEAAAQDATDAALDASEDAKAASALAQEAVDAVADLSTQVAKLIAALKKQITTLTNLVIKIQKKVNA